MEGRNTLSALVRVGQLWFWRAAIHFLSAAFLDAGSSARFCGAVECGAGRIHCSGANAGGNFDVCAGATVLSTRCCDVRSRLLCSQSLRAACRVHAKRFCRGTRVRADAGAAVGGAAIVRADGESVAFVIPSDGHFRDAVCGGVAFQRACGSIGKLQAGCSLCVGSDCSDIFAAAVAWRRMLLLGGAATILMLRASSILWTLLPELRFLQFSWRWMAILAVPYSYFGAAAIVRRRGAWVGSVVAVMVLASGSTATFLVHQ